MYTTEWFIPNRVIYLQIEGFVSGEEIYGMNDALNEKINAGTSPVYIVADVTGVEVGLYKVSDLKAYTYLNNPKLAMVLGVTGNKLIGLLVSLLVNITANKVKLTSSFDKVLEELWLLDPGLDKSQADYSVIGKLNR
jgi:hypothetical protein